VLSAVQFRRATTAAQSRYGHRDTRSGGGRWLAGTNAARLARPGARLQCRPHMIGRLIHLNTHAPSGIFSRWRQLRSECGVHKIWTALRYGAYASLLR